MLVRIRPILYKIVNVRRASRLQDLFSSPERIFTLIAAVFGIIMVFVMPAFMIPDEVAHFDRAYQVGEGRVVASTRDGITGGYVPTVVQHGIAQFTKTANYQGLDFGQYVSFLVRRINTHDTTFTRFVNQAVYSPINYLPQAVGIDIGRLLYPSPGVMVFLGRLFNLAAYIAIVSLTIRYVKRGKWVYMVAALFPTAIQQAASLSGDAITIAVAFGWIAYIQNLLTQRTPIVRRQLIIGAILAATLALTKQSNVILLLPILFVPVKIFHKGGKWRSVGIIGGVGVLCAAVWYGMIKMAHYILIFNPDPGVNQSLQLKGIIHDPLNFITTLSQTYFYQGINLPAIPNDLIVGAYGTFSYLFYSLPFVTVLIGYVTFLIALLYGDATNTTKGAESATKKLAVINGVVIVVSLVVIATLQYLTWSPVYNRQVTGLQGRYYIPLLPLLIPIFVIIQSKLKLVISKPYHVGMIVSAGLLIGLIQMVSLTLGWFYFPS